MVHGDRSFDYRDADFVLFGVTAEEIRWLQPRAVVPRVTVRPLRRRRHLRQWARRERPSRTRHCPGSVVCAPVVVWAFTDLCRLWALAQEGSGMSLAIRGAICVALQTARCGRALLVPRVLPPPLTIERRFMRRVAHRVRPRESGCPIHKKQLLPVLVVWAPPRKKRNQEHHALNGNTSPSAAGSLSRSVRQRVDFANDDDLELALVLPATAPGAAADGPGRPHTDLGARLERLLTRGKKLTNTLDKPVIMQLDIRSLFGRRREGGLGNSFRAARAHTALKPHALSLQSVVRVLLFAPGGWNVAPRSIVAFEFSFCSVISAVRLRTFSSYVSVLGAHMSYNLARYCTTPGVRGFPVTGQLTC